MKTAMSVIAALMAASVIAAADPTWGTTALSLASVNDEVVFNNTSTAKIGLALSQPARLTGSVRGNGLQENLLPVVSKASGSTLLIIGTAMVAGGYVLFKSTDEFNTATILAIGLMGAGGIVIYKGIEVLIFRGPGKREAYGRGGLRLALRVSF